MLIKALCDYYDELRVRGKTSPDGYEEVNVNYLICLDDNGKVVDIVSNEIEALMPKRESKSTTYSEIIEHRAEYIFGLSYNKGVFIVDNSVTKKHNKFVERNSEFIDDIDSKLANAYKNFIKKWNPNKEVHNILLEKMGKEYINAKFIFCLNKEPDKFLNEDKKVKEKWERSFNQNNSNESKKSICAIYGDKRIISRTHRKIKKLYDSEQYQERRLVSFKNDSECSYCNTQSYNSNISEYAMNKYTEALNCLTENNCKRLDDVSIVYFAIGNKQTNEYDIIDFIFGKSDGTTSKEIENVLFDLFEKIGKGIITNDKLIFEDYKGNFYIVGIKPNVSRISIKFIYKNTLGKVTENVLRHQLDFKIQNDSKPIYLWQIRNELLSQKSKTEALNPSLITNLLSSIINGYKYPVELLSSVIRRIKVDRDAKISDVRIGIIKAYINRKCRIDNKKEEITMGLNCDNNNQAYLCGRLFAVLEKTQESSLNGKELNKTIKDSYFSSAMSRPALIFPKLIKLSQYHINNIDKDGSKVYFNKLIGEVMDKLNNEFPKNLFLEDQGRFVIGYYQQRQEFFKKKENNKEFEEE